MTNKDFLIAIFITVSLASGQALWKLGLNKISFSLFDLSGYMRICKSPYVLTGLLLYLISTILWFGLLGEVQFSKLYPVLAFGYVLGVVFGYLIFDEKISVINWLGTFFITLGIFMLSVL